MLWPPGNVIAKRFQALVKSVLSEVELRHVFLDDLTSCLVLLNGVEDRHSNSLTLQLMVGKFKS